MDDIQKKKKKKEKNTMQTYGWQLTLLLYNNIIIRNNKDTFSHMGKKLRKHHQKKSHINDVIFRNIFTKSRSFLYLK